MKILKKKPINIQKKIKHILLNMKILRKKPIHTQKKIKHIPLFLKAFSTINSDFKARTFNPQKQKVIIKNG